MALKMAGGLAAKWHGHCFCQQGVAGQISTSALLLLCVFTKSFEVSVLHLLKLSVFSSFFSSFFVLLCFASFFNRLFGFFSFFSSLFPCKWFIFSYMFKYISSSLFFSLIFLFTVQADRDLLDVALHKSGEALGLLDAFQNDEDTSWRMRCRGSMLCGAEDL